MTFNCNISDILFLATYMYSVTGNFSEAENIDDQPLAQVSVGTAKTTQDPLDAIDAILAITGKYLITYI